MKVIKKKTNRIEKVNSLIEHLLPAIILPYLQHINGLVTVTKVECSRDLRWAKVWVSVFNNSVTDVTDAAINTLQNNIYDIQGELNRNLAMKMVPRLQFKLDSSGEYAQHINQVFRKIEEIDK